MCIANIFNKDVIMCGGVFRASCPFRVLDMRHVIVTLLWEIYVPPESIMKPTPSGCITQNT